KLALLNSLVHPAVFRDSERWMEEQQLKKTPYLLKEAALLIETGSYKGLDKLIVVTAPYDQRMQRVLQRDDVGSAEVNARMQHQLPEEEKVKLADFIITNDSDLAHLAAQVANLHAQLSALSAAV